MKTKILLLTSLCFLLLLVGLPPAASGQEMAGLSEIRLTGRDFGAGTLDGLTADSDGLTLAPGALSGHYLSPPLEAPLAFDALAAAWLVDTPEGSSFSLQMRTGNADGSWSEWTVVEEDHDLTQDEETEVTGQLIFAPKGAGPQALIELRVTLTRLEEGLSPVLHDLRLTLIKVNRGLTAAEMLARQQEIDKQLPPRQESGYPKPTVISRQVWCTDPRCNYGDGLEYVSVNHLVVHHTVTGNDYTDSAVIMRAIWLFHTVDRGWGDIGYNYLIDKNGLIYEGHLGGDDVVGTHASGGNYGSMGVSLIGTFTDVAPPAPMLDALAKLLAWKADQKGIDVFDASHMPVVDCNGDPCNVRWGVPNLAGHRDVRGYPNTVCPGDKAHELLPWLRGEVANRIGFVSPHQYIDELSAAFSKSSTGTWLTAQGGCGFNGHAFYALSTTVPADSTNWGEWQLQVPACGIYKLEVYAPYCITNKSETAGASYQVSYNGGSNTVVTSHDANVGTWMSLGEFNLVPNSGNKLRLTNLTGTDTGLGVWFDAVRLLPVSVPPPPVATNQQPVQNIWLKSRSVTFNWGINNTAGVDGVRLEVATDAGFSSIILSQNLTGPATSFTATFNQDYARLYWRVTLNGACFQPVKSTASYFGIDSKAPTSQVTLVHLLENGRLALGWNGSDQTSGINTYTVQYKAMGGADWLNLATNVSIRSATFTPEVGKIYLFRSLATDKAGNAEQKDPAVGDITSSEAIPVYRAIMLPQIFLK